MTTNVVDFETLHILRDEKEYEAVISRIDALLDTNPAEGSVESDELDFWSVLVKEYEDRHHPIGPPSAPELVKFMLAQKGMKRSDLNEIMGGKARVSDFFNGVRTLSIAQLISLRKALGIPADLLLAGAAD